MWCLTPKRTQEVYEKIFKVLRKKSEEYGFNFEPQRAYLDFEIGTINALEKMVIHFVKLIEIFFSYFQFPNISIHGCWYHFTQCMYRNIRKLGLSTSYEKIPKAKVWFRCFMALPLVKHSAVHSAIDYLLDNPPSSDEALIKFKEYFQKQWLNSIPVRYWNLGPIHLRCNNTLEGTTVQLAMIINRSSLLLFRL